MIFLLDTNACIAILNGTSERLVSRLRTTHPENFVLCSVVKAELFTGARKSGRVAENLALLETFFAPFRSLPFDDRCAEHYGLLRADLERAGRPLGPNDLIIAAIARAHDAALISHDLTFRQVVGLKVEDWEN